jgi:adenylate cyclase
MTTPPSAKRARFYHGIGIRQVRLGCGLVLFAYLVSHFLNHALGNISLDALEIGAIYHTDFWQNPLVTTVFYGAMLIHAALGLWTLYGRRELRPADLLQITLGLSIPLLLAFHVIGIRLAQTLYGAEKLYPQALYVYWVQRLDLLWVMQAAVLVSWIHGCMGLYFWLRLKRFYRRAAPLLFALAVLLPTLALLGVYQGGRDVVASSASPEWRARELTPPHVDTPEQAVVLDNILWAFLIGYLALIGLMLLGRGLRLLRERRGGLVRLTYGDGRTVRIPKGLSVLEASHRFNIPHASVCGGRARCSTCRIRVLGDVAALPEPSKREAFVLDRIGAGDDPAVRLACQLVPTSDISFVQMFQPQIGPAALRSARPRRAGQERYLVSMFVDMRGSTKLAENLLPFDTVYIVNQFLNAVSQAVTASGGLPNQFYGDGQLALFGLHTDPQTACRQALTAAARIAERVDDLNEFLVHDGRDPIRFGIGIHAGEVIVGDIGTRDHTVFTALGDAVNVAARLQDMTKSLACEAIISEEVYRGAKMPDHALPVHDVAIRGRIEQIRIRTVANSAMLADLVDGRASASVA